MVICHDIIGPLLSLSDDDDDEFYYYYHNKGNKTNNNHDVRVICHKERRFRYEDKG